MGTHIMNGGIIARITLAVLAGLLFSLYLLQNDHFVRGVCQEKLKKMFEQSFDCVAQATLKHINFFSAELEGERIEIVAPDGTSWHWKAQSIKVNFSWLSLILNRKVGLEITLQQVDAFSELRDNSLLIFNHLKKMIEGAIGLPITLKGLIVRKGTLEIIEPHNKIRGYFVFSSQISAMPERFKAALYLIDGTIEHNLNQLLHSFNATISFEKQTTKTDRALMNIMVDGRCILDRLLPSSQELHILGRFAGNQGKLSLEAKDRSYFIDIDVNNAANHIQRKVQGHIPLNVINNIIALFPEHTVDGTADFSLQTNNDDCDGSIVISNAGYLNYPLGTITTHINSTNGVWNSTIMHDSQDSGHLEAVFHFNQQTMQGRCDLYNTDTIKLPSTEYWIIKPHDFRISFSYDSAGVFYGTYAGTISHTKIDTILSIQGKLWIEDDRILLNGNINEKNYHATFHMPTMTLEKLSYYDEKGNTLINASMDHQYAIVADITYALIRSCMSNFFEIDTLGQGTFHINANVDNNRNIAGTLSLQEGNIQVSPTYNFIRSIMGNFLINTSARTMLLNDAMITFHKGNITCKRARIDFDTSGITFMHIPLVVQQLFLNIEKELFSWTSGTIIMHKQNIFSIKGKLLIDRGQLKKNIFSPLMQRYFAQAVGNSFVRYPLNTECNLIIETKKPIHIKTSFLETDAIVALTVKGSINNPHVSGNIILSMGSLGFPYKSLYITQGILYFLPNQLNDPVLELTAKGKIKKYHITLRASGSLHHPHIILESAPPLTEEQILTLLLAGSEKGSFALVMPTLIMQNVQNIMFGPEQSSSKLETYFKNLLAPLRHIRIVPSFTDQSGRGGFRGAIEIDVNDQLHGVIQKNFSLPEDTKFEVEYDLSDDISLRGIKDERGDLGGEVEIRWKF